MGYYAQQLKYQFPLRVNEDAGLVRAARRWFGAAAAKRRGSEAWTEEFPRPDSAGYLHDVMSR